MHQKATMTATFSSSFFKVGRLLHGQHVLYRYNERGVS
jgi:hypothetical protein